jgi:hypothetical protein
MVGLYFERVPPGDQSPLEYWTAEYVYEPKLMCVQRTDYREFLDPDDNVPTYRPYVRLPDRRLFMDGTHFFGVKLGVPGIVPEGPRIDFFGDYIGAGRNDLEVVVSGGAYVPGVDQTDRLGARFYNTVTQDWSSPLYYTSLDGRDMVYAPEFGVFLSVQQETLGTSEDVYTVRVWSLEVDPFEISEPEVVGGSVRSGQVVTYRVRVWGDAHDPCEGELVNWLVSGSGRLLDAQSTTDAQGYATVQVQYAVGEVGESTITASLRC